MDISHTKKFFFLTLENRTFMLLSQSERHHQESVNKTSTYASPHAQTEPPHVYRMTSCEDAGGVGVK